MTLVRLYAGDIGMRTIFRTAAPYRTSMYLLVAVLITGTFALAFQQFGQGIVDGTLSRMTFVYVHAIVVSLWCVLFIVQVVLIRRRRVSWHRSLGVAGIWLTAVLVADGMYTSIRSAKLGGEHVFAPPPVFLAFLLVLGVEVAVLAGIGLAMRHRPEIHKRLMLATFVTMLPVALVRLPLGFFGGALGALALTDAALLAATVHDAVRRRAPHPAFVLALLFLLIMQPLSFALVLSPSWSRFIRSMLGSLGI
jgi:uncharacterized membrane protein YozB (DUF420 family)